MFAMPLFPGSFDTSSVGRGMSSSSFWKATTVTLPEVSRPRALDETLL